MKQTKLWIGFLGICLIAAAREASAAIAIQDGVPWVYEVVSGGASILHGPGCGDVIVPAELDCYPVCFIPSNAFASCSGLTSVTLPGSVTSIGTNAFAGCSGLKTLCLPLSLAGTTYAANSGVPSTCAVLYGDAWEDVGGLAWSYVVEDGKATVTAGPRQGNVTIPAVLGGHPVTGIGSNAFFNCNELTSVTIPNSLTIIGGRAFYGCSGLASVTIPDNVTSIENSAFYACIGLTSVTIGNRVTDIGGYAFFGCSGLASMTIPDSVTSIGGGAFSGCSGLTNVTIGNSVTNIGSVAFSSCSGLTSVTIPDSVTSIGDFAFSSCSGLTSVTIPDSVASIGYLAFEDCSGLTAVNIHDVQSWCEIDFGDRDANPLVYAKHLYIDGKEVEGDLAIPDGTKTIGNYAFYYCTNLTSVAIPDSVASIGYDAFSGCTGLTSVMIPDSVTSIGSSVFFGCTGLTSVTIPDSVTSIGFSAFHGCASTLFDTNSIPGVRLVDGWAVGHSFLTGALDLTGVRGIAGSAFSRCGLTSVTIGDSVTCIGFEAFYDCDLLTSVTIGDNVTSIENRAFFDCSGLKTLYAPEPWKTKYVFGVFWSEYAGVPDGCEIIYSAPQKTSTGVPHTWLAGYGLGDGTAEGYEAAAAAKAANRAYTVADCYVAGLDPTDPAATFSADMTFTNGAPVVSWTPDLNEGGTQSARSYEVQGKPTMADDWDATNSASRFFRVKVELPMK